MIITVAAVLGCSGGPTPVKVPPIQAEEAADAAFSLYDKDGDGLLKKEELSDCPAFQDAMKNNIDKNKDRQLSKDELVGRLSTWVNGGVGASFFSCRVTSRGRPLVGAQVKLIPEAFFGGVIQPAVGTTDRTGRALMSIDPSNLPEDLQNLRAVQQGHYRVEITHQNAKIPAKYNTETTLGVEVSFEKGRNSVNFKL
jgi:hypothetical protein